MSDFSFRPGSSKLAPPRDIKELAELVDKADMAFWNGQTGVTRMSWDGGSGTVHLFISLSSSGLWHIRYEFPDQGFMIAHDTTSDHDKKVSLWIGGNECHIPADQFVHKSEALPIMTQFMENGQLYEMADWRIPKS